MARKTGDRNADFEATRAAILDRLTSTLMSPAAATAGLRVLAGKAEVSVATLRHYFGDRAGVVDALMARIAELGRGHLETVREPQGSFADSLRALALFLSMGFSTPVVLGVHVLGLAEGPRNAQVGEGYLVHILEPILQAVEARFETHMERGEMIACDPRVAALSFVSPIFMAYLHQGALCGTAVRPMILDETVAAHVDLFVSAFTAAGGTSSIPRVRTAAGAGPRKRA